MKLYSYWRSSSSWRVRIALAFKSLPFDYVAINLLRDEEHKPAYKALNPLGQVPVLATLYEGQNVCLAQSLAIIEFLEETHPEPPLLPYDALLRAKVRQLTNIMNAGMQPLHNLPVLQAVEKLGANKNTWVRTWLTPALEALEKESESESGMCMVGDDVTIADVFLVPQLAAARRFEIDLAPYPKLLRIEAYLCGHAAFRFAHADRQPDSQPAPQSTPGAVHGG